MVQLRSLLFVLVGLLLSGNTVLAANYAVGTCKPSLPSYSTISAAVSGVPPGSTVLVCPGTYAEQITISQPLTLKGIASGNTSDVIIAVPSSGLTAGTDSFGVPVAALVTVGAGPVNVSNITVDGTGANETYPTWLIGILYLDGSSGLVNEVTVRQLHENCCTYASVGVWAEGSSGEAITIENSSFHDIDDSSVIVERNIVATVKGNSMEAADIQVQWTADAGSLTGNVMNGGYAGAYAGRPITISGNTITNSGSYGLWFPISIGGLVVTSNKISNVPTGIYFSGGGDTYKSNTITKVGTAIEFNCFAPTVVSNTINEATTGLDQVPASFSNANSFNSVVTIRTGGCGSSPTKQTPVLPGKPGEPMVAHAR